MKTRYLQVIVMLLIIAFIVPGYAASMASYSSTDKFAPKITAMPVFGLPGGAYNTAQSVTISNSITGATIRYTTDGSEPVASSAQYTGPIGVSATTTIKAKVFKTGMIESDTASATYTISPITAPIVSTTGATDMTVYTANLHGNILKDGGAAITEQGFYWGGNASNPENHVQVGTSVTIPAAINYTLSNLNPGMMYSY